MESTPACRMAAFAFTAAMLAAQQAGDWQDTSKHRVQFVAVDDNVKLEVLDWGGKGRPIVLLAGYNTAHIYDDFAMKLAQTNRVYGITRRGYGASSRPDSGYTAQRSAEDVLQVLRSLELKAPVLAGHSFGGQDLTTLGSAHPDRVAGLVYLNSAEDATLGDRIWSMVGVNVSDLEAARRRAPASMRTPPSPPDNRSFQAYRDWQRRTHEVAFPESELRRLFTSNADGTVGKPLTPKSVRDAIFAGVQKPEYSLIRVPVLALFAAPPPFEVMVQRHQPKNSEERAAMRQIHDANVRIGMKQRQDLRDGVPTARIVELPGANYYVFLSNEQDVLREIREFVAGLR